MNYKQADRKRFSRRFGVAFLGAAALAVSLFAAQPAHAGSNFFGGVVLGYPAPPPPAYGYYPRYYYPAPAYPAYPAYPPVYYNYYPPVRFYGGYTFGGGYHGGGHHHGHHGGHGGHGGHHGRWGHH